MTELQETRRRLEAAGVRYVFGACTDINGVPKSKCVPWPTSRTWPPAPSSTPSGPWRGRVSSAPTRTSA